MIEITLEMIKGRNLDYNKYKKQLSQHSNFNLPHQVLLTNNSINDIWTTKKKTLWEAWGCNA